MGLAMSVQEFLDSLPSKGTKNVYKYGLNTFLKWYGKTANDVLKERKDDLTQRPNEDIVTYRNRSSNYEKIIESFYNYLIDKGYKINAAKSVTNGIRQLFRYYHMDVRMRKGSNVNRTIKTQRNFPLTIEHVRKMYAVADFRERVILSMATDLGLRIGDFLEIKKGDLPDLSLEAPISFDVMTDKEDVIAKGFLSHETVDLIKKYLETLPEDNPYLFPSSQNAPKPISKTQLGNLLRDLAEKAGIKINNSKRLTFHCFRKMFLSAAIDSGIGLTAGKKLCGKAIPNSDDTYLTTVKLREKFVQLKKFLTIKEVVQSENVEIEEMKGVVSKLQEDLTQQRIIAEIITEENINIKNAIQTIAKTIVGQYPIGKLKEKKGKLYEEKVVGVDLKTGKFLFEDVEVSDEDMIGTYDSICDLVERSDEEIKRLLKTKHVDLALKSGNSS
jgi:integrase